MAQVKRSIDDNRALIKVMSKLIQLQKQTKSTEGALLINDQLITEEEEIREQWADYYEQLGTPKSTDENLMNLLDLARKIAADDPTTLMVDAPLVKKAITSLNSGKAADINGLAAEHFKAISEDALQILTSIINKIIQHHKVPENLKESFKISLHILRGFDMEEATVAHMS